jgi:hypothetical protein
MEHWYSSNDQRVIIGLSDCSLLFPIGTFHTNSFLCHPLGCTEVVASGLYRLLPMRPGGVTTLPLLPTSAARLCGHLRRHLQRWIAPAVGVGGGGATLATATDVGGTSYHLRSLGCGLAQRRHDGSAAQWLRLVEWCTINIHAIQTLCAAAFQARFCCGPERLRLLSSKMSYDRHTLSCIRFMTHWLISGCHMTGTYWYIPPISRWWHHVVSSDMSHMTGIWQSWYDNTSWCHMTVIYRSYRSG